MKKSTLQFLAVAFFLVSNITSFAQSPFFNVSPNSGCPGLNVTFTPSGLSGATMCEWKFNDGSPTLYDSLPFMASVSHTYNNSGYYVASLSIWNAGGTNFLGTSNGSSNIQVTGAEFNSPDSACVNDVVSFCMNGQGANSYSWNFGDGATSSNGGCVDHAYTSLGSYTVTLTANTSCGNQTASRKVVVANPVTPHPNAWANQNTSCPAKPINFQTNGYASYSWNFGDPGSGANNTSTVQYPSHTYGTVGTYTATVTVTNGCGKTGQATTTVSIVNNPPWPNQSWFKMEVNSSPSCPNSNVSFNAPNGYSSYEWNFGDGSPLSTTTGNNNYNNHTYGSTLTTYTVSVKISSGCGNDTTLYNTVVINNNGTFPNQSWFQLNANSPSCPNSSAGFEAPGGYSSYVWNFGDGSPLTTTTDRNNGHIYGSTITTYTVSVKITNGCGNDTTLYKSIEIKNNVFFPNQNFSINVGPNPACPGDNVNWNAPYGGVKYEWDFGDGDSATTTRNDANHAYLTTGTYNGSVKITNGCGNDTTIYGSVVINNSGVFPNYLQIEANSSSCPDELLEFRVNQNGFPSYSWNFGDGSPLVTSNLERTQHSYVTTGSYTVICTITNGCSNTTTISAIVQVASNSPVNSNLSIENTQNPSCPNDKVFFIPDKGQSNYQYVWNFGDGSPSDTTLGAGADHIYTSAATYTISVIVTNGCGLTKALSLTQVVSNTSVPALIGNDGKKQWGFPGSEDGSNLTAGCSGDAIIFYFMGETANNLWDFGDGNTGTATESMLVNGGDGGAAPVTIIKHSFAANGSFKIKLTLTNNCGNSVTDSMTITIGGNLLVDGEMATSPPPFTTCASIDFLGFGGATYGWNFGDGSPTLTTSSPTISHTFSLQGPYMVSVLITNGCGNSATYSKAINITGVGGPAVSLSSSINPSCVNESDGNAVVTVTSGEPPYIYLWNDSNGQTSATATGLSAGLYNVMVTDNIGCASTLAVSINNPAPIVLGFTTGNAGCGQANGSATASVTSGGTGPYTYQWSTGETAATATGLASGAYSVIVTDNDGCTSGANASVSENGGPTLSLNSAIDVTNVSCNGQTNGAINLGVSGAVPPYTYLWSNGSTVQDPTGLSAGNYSVEVFDNTGCKSTINTSVSQPTALIVNTTAAVSPSCGNFDGTASSTGSGGTGPYTYLWDPGAGSNKTTQSVSGLPAGSYTVTVTDNKGCTSEGEVSLSNSNAPNITAVVTDVSCNGLTNGAINVTVTGGTSPYLYTWNVAPPNTQDKTNLAAGNYMVFVNDASGCISFRSFTILEPAALSTSISVTSVTCSSSNGTATANTLGGNTPYSYLWSGGKTTQTATGLSVGSYTVTVTDNKGCTAKATSSISVAAPTPSLCMVTVDDASVNNIIYWDKTAYTNVDSFIVYREVSTNVYKRIAAIAQTALSEYTDVNRGVGPANGDPNVGAYRYKLQIRDACGNYSVLSPYHNTIYIQDGGSGQFDWNLPYTVEGGANPVANYDLICDLANLDSWFSTGIVSGTQSSATDPAFASRPGTARWRVETVWGITCTPTRATINTTRSNIKSAVATGIQTNKGNSNEMLLYPNPATATVTIQYPAGNKKNQLQVFDALGQLVYEEALSVDNTTSQTMLTKQLDVSTYRKGIYIINVQTENGNTFKRLAIQ